VKLVVAPQWKFGNFFGNLKKILGLNRRGYFDFFCRGVFGRLGAEGFLPLPRKKTCWSACVGGGESINYPLYTARH
jgi:hypothetical protein